MDKKEKEYRVRFFAKCILVVCLSLCLALLGCGCSADQNTSPIEDATEQSSKAVHQKISEESKPALSVLTDQDEELAFALSVNDFISCYNGYYLQEHGMDYLEPAGQWRIYTAAPTIHSAHESTCYAFSEDERVRSLPVLSVHTSDGTSIRQITVSYDDHSYSPQTYEIYEEMCCYVLKVMFPELGEDVLLALRDRLNGFLDDGVVSEVSSDLPYIVYHEGAVAVYPYYAAGHSLEIRIIPVMESSLEEMAFAGVKIEGIME